MSWTYFPLGCILISLGIYMQRTGSALWQPYFYAEDGQVFFREQMLYGASALGIPFAGYLHLVPRLTALLAAPFSAVWGPALYAWINLIVVVWVAATIATCRLPYAWALTLLVFAVPHNGEVFGTITNVQWLMACALPLLALTPSPDRTLYRLNQRAYVLASGLSGPFAIFALPLFLWRLGAQRDRHAVWIVALAAIAGVVQGVVTAQNYVAFHGEREPLHLGLTLLDRWLGSLAYGWRSDTPMALVLTCGYAIVMGGLAWFSEHRRLNGGLLFFALAILCATWLKFMPGLSHHFDWPNVDDRYLYVPKVMAVWVLASALYAHRLRMKVLAVGALVLSLTSIQTHHFDWWNKHQWPRKPWAEQARAIDAGEAVSIPINPPPYKVELPARK